jgi:hypothetical protein
MSQNRITKAARGRDCQVRIPGVFNGNPETTVLAHYRMAGTNGMGCKPNDLQGAWACSACHDLIDGRTRHPDYNHFDTQHMHAEGVFRTLDTLIREGILKI